MKTILRMIAALLIAIMTLTTAALAEEPDENITEAIECIDTIAEETAEDEAETAEAETEALDANEVAEEETEDEAEPMEEAVEFDEEAATDEETDGEASEISEAETPEALEEMDLMAAFDEADMPEVEEADEAEDKTEKMAALIDETIAAHQSEGIYGALDAAYEALAENASELSNPETGVIEVSGDEIVEMTLNAMEGRFDVTPEQMTGAFGAATMRAAEKGILNTLGGDATLASIAASQSLGSAEKDARKIGKATFETLLESIAVVNPSFKPFVVLFKSLGGYMFDSPSSDPNAAVLAKLDEIETQIKNSEENLRNHTYNVVSLAKIGDKYFTLEQWSETVRDKIDNIRRNKNLSETEKKTQVADLYNSAAFDNMTAALKGATLCFTSTDNGIFDKCNIFDAAYDRACTEVMFSQEAIELTTPYLVRQLAIYTAACATMEDVLDCYEEVYGAGSVLKSREYLMICNSGVNLEGEQVGGSIAAQFRKYYTRSGYIFVNKSNTTKIQLSSHIHVVTKFCEPYYGWNSKTAPTTMAKNPLNADQVKSLARYCAGRGTTLFEFLFNDMQFRPCQFSDEEKARQSATDPLIDVPPFYYNMDRAGGGYYYFKPDGLNVSSGKIYLATGAQKFEYVQDTGGCAVGDSHYYMQVINANKKDATNERFEVWSRVRGVPKLCTMLFFQ